VRKNETLTTGLPSDEYDLDTIVATWWEPVMQWILSTRKVRGGEVDEVRQEVFLRLTREIRAGRRYRVPLHVVVFKMTSWTVQGYVQKAAGHREREEMLGEMPADEPVDHGALREIDAIGEDDLMDDLFARLGDREGTLMRLHYVEGIPLADVAGIMGITANNAHQIHHRAKRHLAAVLAEEAL
jgi:RNA polymerase sigma factor (sigma-70 family)